MKINLNDHPDFIVRMAPLFAQWAPNNGINTNPDSLTGVEDLLRTGVLVDFFMYEYNLNIKYFPEDSIAHILVSEKDYIWFALKYL